MIALRVLLLPLLLAVAGACHAQALRPLPPDFLATLDGIDASADEMSAAVLAIKNADFNYSMFSSRRIDEAIARMQQTLPILRTQTADLRRNESLMSLLAMKTTFGNMQRDLGSISDILHGVTVRSQAQADALDTLLASLDAATAHLDAALKKFDAGALALMRHLDEAAARKQP